MEEKVVRRKNRIGEILVGIHDKMWIRFFFWNVIMCIRTIEFNHSNEKFIQKYWLRIDIVQFRSKLFDSKKDFHSSFSRIYLRFSSYRKRNRFIKSMKKRKLSLSQGMSKFCNWMTLFDYSLKFSVKNDMWWYEISRGFQILKRFRTIYSILKSNTENSGRIHFMSYSRQWTFKWKMKYFGKNAITVFPNDYSTELWFKQILFFHRSFIILKAQLSF
jgi:hypothetical protein